MRDGDAAGIASAFAPASRLYDSGNPDLDGPRAIRDAFAEHFDTVRVRDVILHIDTIEVVDGGSAWSSGWIEQMLHTDDDSVRARSRYAARWRHGPEAVWRMTTMLLIGRPIETLPDSALDDT